VDGAAPIVGVTVVVGTALVGFAEDALAHPPMASPTTSMTAATSRARSLVMTVDLPPPVGAGLDIIASCFAAAERPVKVATDRPNVHRP
jgi:hypothetical protein